MQFLTFRRWSSKGLTRDFCLLLTPAPPVWRLRWCFWRLQSARGPREAKSPLALDDPTVKQTCQQKADGEMKQTRKEGLSDGFKFIRSGKEMWKVLLGPYCCSKLCSALEFLLFLADITHHMCSNIGSHLADSPAHRRCWHLLRDPRRRQGAQSLPEGQGAAGDQAPQSHGEGEDVFCPALKKPFRVVLMLISLPFAIHWSLKHLKTKDFAVIKAIWGNSAPERSGKRINLYFKCLLSVKSKAFFILISGCL